MKLEFLNFESADAKKRSDTAAESMNINIDVTDARLENGTLKIEFNYTVAYAPDQSYIRLGGRANFGGPDAKRAYEEWKKTKRITGDPGEQLVNTINYSASVNALFIARVFNLMPPVVPPVIKFGRPPAKKT